jgi:hypothetical protein
MSAHFAEKDAWRLDVSRYAGGWSWSTAPTGAMWEHSGWALTRRGAIRKMRRLRKGDERVKASRESWTEGRPLPPGGSDA